MCVGKAERDIKPSHIKFLEDIIMGVFIFLLSRISVVQMYYCYEEKNRHAKYRNIFLSFVCDHYFKLQLQ